VPTSFGIDAQYWNIHALDLNRPQQSVQVVLAGYISAATRMDGHQPIALVTVRLAGPDFPGTPGGLDYAAVYAAIKRNAALTDCHDPVAVFAGAGDC
jgi:hypothetical protein